MFRFLKDISGEHFVEHHKYPEGEDISNLEIDIPPYILFLNKDKCKCFEVKKTGDKTFLQTSYYIGVDWIVENNLAIFIQPKLNVNNSQIDYLKMLFQALKHSEVTSHTKDLYEIKFGKPDIEIDQKLDLLTPLLVVHFLSIVKEIVRKGLKKSYYSVAHNLHGKIKGKVLVGQTIKKNLLRNKPLNTVCQYDEFGFNSLENRLLKKALLFIQRYLPSIKNINTEEFTTDTFNYILPAFENVSGEINLNEIKHSKINVFYKEYFDAVHLAKLILKRFGYNISSLDEQQKIKTPPFWIDMSKLFELYVLGMLKDRYREAILYGEGEANGNYGLPDYLLVKSGAEMVIDAKYKPFYQRGNYDIENIRQLSGYARDKGVITKLKISDYTVPDCLIIYPDQSVERMNLNEVNLKADTIDQFTHFYKVAVRLPVI
jgi:5-methylcytosine-specific restriction enzyme subunit McrC